MNAAAPDMLAALKRAEFTLSLLERVLDEGGTLTLAAVRAAIAKAEGRS